MVFFVKKQHKIMSFSQQKAQAPPKWEDWMLEASVGSINSYLRINNFEELEIKNIKKYIRTVKNRNYSKKSRDKRKSNILKKLIMVIN